jgi:hypothetical protein
MNDLKKCLLLGLIPLAMLVIGIVLMLAACSSPRTYLPHRPLHEIDIQGHQQYAPRRDCPAVYDAPNGNLRFCL